MPRSGKILAHFVPANVSTLTSKQAPKKVTESSGVSPVLSAYSQEDNPPDAHQRGMLLRTERGGIGYREGKILTYSIR